MDNEKDSENSTDKAESGLEWGFEIESLVLAILGDAEEIEEKIVLDLLMEQRELKPLLKKFENSSIPSKNGGFRTVREELRYLLQDVTNGNWHTAFGIMQGEHRKLSRWKVRDGKTEYIVLRRVKDETNNLKKRV